MSITSEPVKNKYNFVEQKKRKRCQSTWPSPRKRFNPITEGSTSQDDQSDSSLDEEQNFGEDKIVLRKVFSALETSLLSCVPANAESFHALQDPIRQTARHVLTELRLAQLMGVWKEGWVLDTVMTFYRGSRIPSVLISLPAGSAGHSSTRRETFLSRLELWTGTLGVIPVMQHQSFIKLNTSKITSIKKENIPVPVKSLPLKGQSSQDRQSSLLARIRVKSEAAKHVPTASQRTISFLESLIPTTITSLKLLLASSRKKSYGTAELIDNLVTSHKNKIGKVEGEKLLRLLAKKQSTWCKISIVGEVEVVRFTGQPQT